MQVDETVGNKIRRVCIADIDTALYIVCYNKKDSIPKTLEECYQQMDDLLNNIFVATDCSHYLLYLTIGKNFRYSIDENYKSNRKKQEKPPFFYEVREYLINKWNAYFDEGFESDDLCVSARKILMDNKIDCIIASPDKDIKMLEGVYYDYKKLEFFETNYKDSVNYFWKSMITGDSSDGIKGIPGKGEVYATKILKDVTYTCSDKVFSSYIDNFGEELGIEEFYKTYKLLKIKDNLYNEVPKLNPVQKAVESKIIEI